MPFLLVSLLAPGTSAGSTGTVSMPSLTVPLDRNECDRSVGPGGVVLLPGPDVGMGLAHGSAGWAWGLLRGKLVFMPVMLAVRRAMSRAESKTRLWRLRIPGRDRAAPQNGRPCGGSGDEQPRARAGGRVSACTGAGVLGLSASVSAASARAVKKPLPSHHCRLPQ
jgi:hypothetical protein